MSNVMKILGWLLVATMLSVGAAGQTFSNGNLVISEVYPSSASQPLGSSGTFARWREFTPGATVASGAFTGNSFDWANVGFSSFGTHLLNRGNDPYDGNISLSPNGRFLTASAYLGSTGMGDPTTFTALQVNRGAQYFDRTLNFGSGRLVNDAYDNGVVRGAVTRDGSTFVLSGPNSGLRRTTNNQFNASTPVTGNSSVVNLNYVNITPIAVAGGVGADRLIVSRRGIFGQRGLLMADEAAGTLVPIPGLLGISGAPNDFVFTSPTTCYIADDSGLGPNDFGGIRRFDYDPQSNVWAQTYILQSGLSSANAGGGSVVGVRSLTYDWNSGVLYAITGTTEPIAPQALVAIEDSGPLSSFITVARPTGNVTWRSVEFVPTPGASVALGLGMLSAFRRKR